MQRPRRCRGAGGSGARGRRQLRPGGANVSAQPTRRCGTQTQDRARTRYEYIHRQASGQSGARESPLDGGWGTKARRRGCGAWRGATRTPLSSPRQPVRSQRRAAGTRREATPRTHALWVAPSRVRACVLLGPLIPAVWHIGRRRLGPCVRSRSRMNGAGRRATHDAALPNDDPGRTDAAESDVHLQDPRRRRHLFIPRTS